MSYMSRELRAIHNPRWARRYLARCHCGIYRYVHDCGRVPQHPFRKASRLRLWFMDHQLGRHLVGWAWLNLFDDIQRMNIADRYYRRRPYLCWCSMVDAALLDMKAEDFRGDWGCGCDVPMLRDVRPPRSDFSCYCEPRSDR